MTNPLDRLSFHDLTTVMACEFVKEGIEYPVDVEFTNVILNLKETDRAKEHLSRPGQPHIEACRMLQERLK